VLQKTKSVEGLAPVTEGQKAFDPSIFNLFTCST
jgi:hypothetical protein